MRHSIHSPRFLVALSLALAVVVTCSLSGAEASVANGSFEQAGNRGPESWRRQTFGGGGDFEYATVGRTGQHSVSIASSQGGDLGWTTRIPVEPFARYRLSGWIKTENVAAGSGRGALLNLHNMQGVATAAVTGTTDWKRVEVEFDTDANDILQVNCLFGGWGMSTGQAWYDDIQLEQIGRSAPAQMKIVVDAQQRGAPISKYVYGQFIEHLGRCIYGGIWAEMLEDRKFYFPVTAEYRPYRRNSGSFPVVAASPWQIIGSADQVTMVQENSFVGEQTPRIAAGAGLRQRDLGLRSQKEYEGYVWLQSLEGTAQVSVSLRWGDGDADQQTVELEAAPGDYAKIPFRLTAGDSTDKGQLEIRVSDHPVLLGTVSLMPADHVHGMRADTLALLQELDSPVYRWPGGNFVSGYDWQDGVGPRDRRPPRKNPAWTGVEHNDFGLDEFLLFCRLLETEPYIAVNSGLGGVEHAVQEVEYANGPATSPMGKRRAENGHPEPYAVKYWGIGNEMYGGWQLGHMPLEDYVKKHNEFADAMRAADQSITLVGVGATGAWSEGMLRNCADKMELLSEHFYCQEQPGLLGHVRQIPNAVRDKAVAHRRYHEEFASLKDKNIPIALDEWNYWYGPHVFGELGTRYFLKDALGIAAGVHEMARQSDVFYMANYAQTVNVIGCIKTTKTDAAFATTGLVLKLYRKHFGQIPVATETSPLLDAQAAFSADGKQLTLAVVNPSTESREVPITLQGVRLAGTGTCWQIAGEDPMVYNEPGVPPRVQIEESSVEKWSDTLSLPACSVTLWRLDVE